MARVFISHSSRDNEPAARIKTWLSEQGFETPFLDYDKHAGIPPGADWEKTLYREIERSEAVIIIQTPNWLDSKWCFAEFTQARALGKSIFPIIETPTGDTLISPDIQALDLRKDREGGLEQLSSQLTQIALDAQGGFGWDASRPPYPGLLAFQEEDAALYFGRDDDIRRLIERLDARRALGGKKLIALLGASGSGKSSLLRAGIIPRLKRAARNWVVLPAMRPQVRPVDELARSLALACGGDADWRKLREELNGDNLTHSLSDIANDLRMQASANEAQILLPIDQGEELFGAADPDQARRFFEILNVALSSDLPFIAVIAMRSDYLGLLQSAEYLTDRFEEFSLGPMPLPRIAQIIEGPARVAGLGIDEAFVHQAVQDAKTEDALPLLAFALRELYDSTAGDNYLSLAEYNALGDAKEGLTPLENAVRKAADNVLVEARPGDEELTALREAFVPAMVRVNEQGEYVRRPARWDDLPSKSHALLERLAKARLLIVSQDGDDRMVEVAHEALLRKWPRLRSWLDDAREFLTGKQQLERDLHDWEHAGEAYKTGALLSGLKLNRARGWLSERPHQLTAQERALIQASIDHAEAEERRKARLHRNITRGAISAALVLAVSFVGSLFLYLEERNSAQAALDSRQDYIVATESANKAKDEAKQNLLLSANSARVLSAQGKDSQLVEKPSLDLSEELVQLWRVYDAASLNDSRRESALRLIGARAPRLRATFRHNKPIRLASFGADGSHVLIVDDEDTSYIWDVKSGIKITEMPLKDIMLKSTGLSSDGNRILVIESRTAAVRDVKSGKSIAVLELRGEQSQKTPPRLNSDGTRALTVSEKNVATVWDVESQTRIAIVILPAKEIRATSFGPEGARVLSFSDTTVRLWDVSRQLPAIFKSPERWFSSGDFAASANGARKATKATDYRYVFASTRNGSLIDTQSWNWTNEVTGRQHDALWQPPVDEKTPHAFAYSPDGTRILTWRRNSTYPPQLWDANRKELIADLKLPELSLFQDQFELVAFSPDGASLVTAQSSSDSLHSPGQDDSDRVVGHRLWDAITGKRLPAKSLLVLAASPDGKRIVTTNEPHTVTLTPLLWDAKTGEQINQLEGHSERILATKFSPDAKRILTRSDDGTTRLWEAETGKLTAILDIPGIQFQMPNAVFSPDGNLVITTTRMGTNIKTYGGMAVLWDATSGLMVERFDSDSQLIRATFSPDSKSVAFQTFKSGAIGAEVWPLHPPARDDPECLRLSVEIRTGLAWNSKKNRTYRLGYDDMSERREQLREKYDGKPCDAPE